MESEERDKIIKKIKKLFALGDNTKNPYEAEVKNALRMARTLLNKYNLSFSEVELKESGKTNIITLNSNEFKHFRGWETRLAYIASKLFKVQIVLGATEGRKLRNLLFIGYKEDANLAKQCFSYLLYTVKFLSGAVKGRISRGAYRDGMIDRLNQRVEEELKIDTPAEEKCKAIMVIKNTVVKSWMKKNMNIKQTTASHRRYSEQDMESYSKGLLAGNNIDLTKRKKLKDD